MSNKGKKNSAKKVAAEKDIKNIIETENTDTNAEGFEDIVVIEPDGTEYVNGEKVQKAKDHKKSKNQADKKPMKQKMAEAWDFTKKFLKSRLCGYIVSIVQLVLTCILLGEILYMNALPVWLFIPICLVMLLLNMFTFLTAQSKKLRTAGKIVSLVFIIIWSMGIYYVGHANDMVDNISGAKTKTDVVNVYTLRVNPATGLNQIEEFGILKALDSENTVKTIADVEKKVGKSITTVEYDSFLELVQALYDEEVDAIILNSAFVETIVDEPAFVNFKTETKILHENTIVTEIEVEEDKDVTNNTFVLYASGIDVTGNISTTSRSDVNILIVVNPDTRQVLMINTPRDYYVPLALGGNPMDKLTHAGIYGVDTSMKTLGNLYGIKVDYFFRVNFTGFKKVIDALGGIEVYSEKAFTTTHGGYKIKQGNNSLNGAQALGFVRERYAFGDGDNQRGRNQMKIIKAIMDKMMSPALLNDFSGLMESLSGSFQTSMTSEQIMALVRKQLNEGGSWNIKSYAVSGYGDKLPVYSMSALPYVMIPYQDQVDRAKNLIQMVYDGKVITDNDVK